jgi:hypothetical protein
VVWAGALVLLAQAVSGRGASFMTPLATIALSVGFVCFVAGLIMASGPSSAQESDPVAASSPSEPRLEHPSQQIPEGTGDAMTEPGPPPQDKHSQETS